MPLAGDYVEPAIFGATQRVIRDEFIDGMSLILGRSYSGIVATYHLQKKQYVLLDGHSGQEFEIARRSSPEKISLPIAPDGVPAVCPMSVL
jgi:hypothetical protein